jgi:hypothetical protein
MRLFNKKEVCLGKGPVHVYTIFEIKWLGGILFHKFETIEQNRYHNHAFHAVSFLLSGSYEEEVLSNPQYDSLNSKVIRTKIKRTVNQWLRPRWIPRDYCHRILKAEPNTWTLLFFGPWVKYWDEFFLDNTRVTYTWGRKIINKVKDHTTYI